LRGDQQAHGGEQREGDGQADFRDQAEPEYRGEQPGHPGAAVAHLQAAVALAHLGVEGIGRGDGSPVRPAADGAIADNLAVFADRRGIGLDPVEAAILAAVLDQPAPWAAGFEIAPQILEGGGWHVGMADDIVGSADQFFARIAADLDKGVVDRGDDARKVGRRVNEQVIGKKCLDIGDWLIVAHCMTLHLVCCFCGCS